MRELVGGTAQDLLAAGKLTPERLHAASAKHPWALGGLGGGSGGKSVAGGGLGDGRGGGVGDDGTQRVGKLEQELAKARAELALTKKMLGESKLLHSKTADV